ncbi:PEP-CTERM sorting domain-containing protein [Propionivibrio soli]|uniref:PEP-CTERM sorting domain-containing protein n=1 Tax=Propionivibrio soli TaxID=2976531 RepID=UPI0021E81431|nr:PEP-CTERM sorting domain-containing protein [Propionivibrio soli]
MPISLPQALHRTTSRAFVMAACGLAFAAASPAAHAIFINFDDIPYYPYPGGGDPDFFAYHPLSNEYQSKGLLIGDGGYLQKYHEGDPNALSSPNYLLVSVFVPLIFVGPLPTYVSLYVSAALQDAVSLSFYGTSGLLGTVSTGGATYPGDPNEHPYQPNEFVSFTAPSGISQINISAYYNTRADAMIDNLTYLYAPTAVPEPSSAALLAMGLVGFAWHRRRGRSRDA